MSQQQGYIYAVKIYDFCNGTIDYLVYHNKKDAVDSVMVSDFKVNKTKSELEKYFSEDKNPFCIEEHNGELYWQWLNREYSFNKLIVPDGKRIPSTFDELRSFMESGEPVTVCGQDRAKIQYQIVRVCGEFPVIQKSFGISYQDTEKKDEEYSIFPSRELAMEYMFEKYFNAAPDTIEDHSKTSKCFIEERGGLLYYHYGKREYSDNIILDFEGESFTTVEQFREFISNMSFFELEKKVYSIVKFEKGELVSV